MPVYEYECVSCGELTERERLMEDRHKRTRCDHCRSVRTKLIISDGSFQLKGGGWYASDYHGKGRK